MIHDTSANPHREQEPASTSTIRSSRSTWWSHSLFLSPTFSLPLSLSSVFNCHETLTFPAMMYPLVDLLSCPKQPCLTLTIFMTEISHTLSPSLSLSSLSLSPSLSLSLSSILYTRWCSRTSTTLLGKQYFFMEKNVYSFKSLIHINLKCWKKCDIILIPLNFLIQLKIVIQMRDTLCNTLLILVLHKMVRRSVTKWMFGKKDDTLFFLSLLSFSLFLYLLQ